VDRKSPGELQEHMLWTYYGLRVGLAVTAFALPIVVAFAGLDPDNIGLLSSLSAYYWHTNNLGAFATRDLFVGGLFAAAACLYLYKGFSDEENVALNLAGVFAVLVALVPTAETPANTGTISKLHGTVAVLFFVCIAYVSLFHSRDTLDLLPPHERPKYKRLYFWTGLTMIVSPLGAVILSFNAPTRTFWAETLAVWAFAFYWAVKTREMRLSEAEKQALDAELKRESVPAPPPAGALRRLAPGSGRVERVVPK
jgi:hypothetical protein